MTFAFIFSDVGFGEWFVLLAVILIVVGPKRLPETARKFGNWYSKFRRAADSFKRQLMDMDTEFERAVSEAEQQVNATMDQAEQQVNEAMAVPGEDAKVEDGQPGDSTVRPSSEHQTATQTDGTHPQS